MWQNGPTVLIHIVPNLHSVGPKIIYFIEIEWRFAMVKVSQKRICYNSLTAPPDVIPRPDLPWMLLVLFIIRFHGDVNISMKVVIFMLCISHFHQQKKCWTFWSQVVWSQRKNVIPWHKPRPYLLYSICQTLNLSNQLIKLTFSHLSVWLCWPLNIFPSCGYKNHKACWVSCQVFRRMAIIHAFTLSLCLCVSVRV